MRLRTVPAMSFAAALLAGSVSSSFADSAADVASQRRRLSDHYFFVDRLGRGWEPLLADLERTVASLSAASAEARPVREILDQTRLRIVDACLRRGGEADRDRAYVLLDALSTSAVDAGRRPDYAQRCAGMDMDRADKLASSDEAQALGLARKALARVPRYERALRMIGALGLRVGLALKAAEDYDEALGALQDTVRSLTEAGAAAGSAALTDVTNAIGEIERTTGAVSVRWLGDPAVLEKVAGAKTDFRTAALRFSGGEREPKPRTVDGLPRRVRCGTWEVTATGVGGAEPQRATVTITPQGGNVVLAPLIPEGMVVVPAGGGLDAFLVDVTEWTNAQWAQVTGSSRGGDARLPVAGVAFADARAAAARAGKLIPTYEQWQRAAFGDSNQPYPWGSAEPDPDVHFVGGQDAPLPPGQRLAGRSPYGCLDMAGNCWEWIEYRGAGWLIGSGWVVRKLERSVTPPSGQAWTPRFLRDPLPPIEVWETLGRDEQDRYLPYRAAPDQALAQAGMRCVVPLGKAN